MAVADGTTDCDSVVVCAARWSHTASGDGMVYASGLYHGGLPVMVGWVASLVVIVDSTTAILNILWWSLPTAQQLQKLEPPHQTFHASLFCFCVCSDFFLCVCVCNIILNMPWGCWYVSGILMEKGSDGNSTRAMEDNILLKEGPEKLFPVWWHCFVPRRPWPTFL